MAFTVRRAARRDLAAVGALTVEAYRDDGLIDADHGYVDELADAARRAREADLWVAAAGSDILGTVTFCSPGAPFAELARGNEAEFRMLAVSRTARRRGVARALVAHCVDRAREEGYDALVLCSMEQMYAAHRLYELLGFRRLAERDWSPVEGVELLAFALPLR
jgi:ribosomal protein S18 acetylase RimI-like enzyme